MSLERQERASGDKREEASFKRDSSGIFSLERQPNTSKEASRKPKMRA